MRRLLVLAVIASAISIPVSFGTLAVSGAAFAGTGITCTGINGNVGKPTPPGVHISVCSPSAGKGYKKALIDDYSETQANLGNLVWKGGAVTTVSDISQTHFSRMERVACVRPTPFST